MARRSKRNTKKPIKQVAPSKSETAERISISKVTLKCAVCGLCLLLLCSLGAIIHDRQVASTANKDKAELADLRQNNQRQLAKIEELSKSTVDLESKMEKLNALDAEIRSIVNNDDKATSRAGLVRPSIAVYKQSSVQLDIEDITKRVSQLQNDMDLREQSLTELKEELLAKQAKAAAIPSIWPAPGVVTSRFGGRGGEFHPGIDIAGPAGTPVVAAADGIVIHSEWDDGGYGNMVQIDHGNGITTIYGHNSAIVAANGQRVRRGQLIAYSGSTGYSTGPHVHYEVRVNGRAVDPAGFLN